MKPQALAFNGILESPFEDADEGEQPSENDLWFLPGSVEDAPDELPPGPVAEPRETSVIADWQQAEAGHAAHLARVAGHLGALDDRLRRGPEGWQHRLALIEAAGLSWFAGDRVSPDRLALWLSLRLAGAQEDAPALSRVGWAMRRLTGGASPTPDLSGFLGRHDPETMEEEAERFADRAASWLELMAVAHELHPITRACMGFHLWSLAGLEGQGARMEAAVTAARIAVGAGQGAVFAPLVMGGAEGLRAGGLLAARLVRWLDGMESAILTAMRHLDDIEIWSSRAESIMAPLSGRTPPVLRAVLTEWPLISAPMAEVLTGASRTAVQRNLAWMEHHDLIREITGQGRFRMWRTNT